MTYGSEFSQFKNISSREKGPTKHYDLCQGIECSKPTKNGKYCSRECAPFANAKDTRQLSTRQRNMIERSRKRRRGPVIKPTGRV